MTSSHTSVVSANGPTYNTLNNSQSISSTPRATPPPRKGSRISSNMSNAARGSFGGYDGQNENGSMMSYQEDYKPQIYRVRRLILTPRMHTYSQHLIRRFILMCLFMKWKSMGSQL